MSEMTPSEQSLREQARKIIRDYYNTTFEYAMEQIQKGDISALLANAEDKQKLLDDPYLDKLEALISKHVEGETTKARIDENNSILEVAEHEISLPGHCELHGKYVGQCKEMVMLAKVGITGKRFVDRLTSLNNEREK